MAIVLYGIGIWFVLASIYQVGDLVYRSFRYFNSGGTIPFNKPDALSDTTFTKIRPVKVSAPVAVSDNSFLEALKDL